MISYRTPKSVVAAAVLKCAFPLRSNVHKASQVCELISEW